MCCGWDACAPSTSIRSNASRRPRGNSFVGPRATMLASEVHQHVVPAHAGTHTPCSRDLVLRTAGPDMAGIDKKTLRLRQLTCTVLASPAGPRLTPRMIPEKGYPGSLPTNTKPFRRQRC